MAKNKRTRAANETPAPAVVVTPPSAGPAALGPIVQLGFIAVAALAVYGFVGMAKEGELRRRCTPICGLTPQYAGVNRKAPSFTLSDLDGKSVSLDDYKNKVVILNLWSTSCLPCRKEIPDLAELTLLLRKRPDVVMLTITNDDNAADVKDFLKSLLREEAPFITLMDPENKVIKDKFGTTMVPETWIIDKRGVIRARFDGQRDWTSGLVTQLIDQVRAGGYCPLDIDGQKHSGEGAFVCKNDS